MLPRKIYIHRGSTIIISPAQADIDYHIGTTVVVTHTYGAVCGTLEVIRAGVYRVIVAPDNHISFPSITVTKLLHDGNSGRTVINLI